MDHMRSDSDTAALALKQPVIGPIRANRSSPRPPLQSSRSAKSIFHRRLQSERIASALWRDSCLLLQRKKTNSCRIKKEKP